MHSKYRRICSYYTAEKNIPDLSSKDTKRVIRDMFVDDLITDADSVEEGRRIVNETNQLHGLTGFKFTKWSSNEASILVDIETPDLAHTIRDITSE